MNVWIGTGRVPRDANVRTTSTGSMVASFTLGCRESYNQKGDQKAITNYVSCSAWGSLAEVAAECVREGAYLCVVGRVTSRKWQAKDGTMKYAEEVNVRELYSLNKEGFPEKEVKAKTPSESESPASAEVPEDQIPF